MWRGKSQLAGTARPYSRNRLGVPVFRSKAGLVSAWMHCDVNDSWKGTGCCLQYLGDDRRCLSHHFYYSHVHFCKFGVFVIKRPRSTDMSARLRFCGGFQVVIVRVDPYGFGTSRKNLITPASHTKDKEMAQVLKNRPQVILLPLTPWMMITMLRISTSVGGPMKEGKVFVPRYQYYKFL